MPGIETILPEDHQFEYKALVLRDEIDDVLHDNIEKYQDILDPNVEFSRDAPKLWALSGVLARLLKSDTETLDDVQSTVYRGVTFALGVVTQLEDKNQIDILSLKSLAEVGGDLDKVICDSVAEYLSARPNLDVLIGKHMPEMDDSAYRNHHAEIAAGLVFMLRERQIGEQFIADQAEALDPESIMK